MDNALYELVRRDARYPVEAYEFLCDAVSYTQELLDREPREEDDPDADYHVCGAELARGACELAVREFGLMAPVVFRQWGVRRTNDLGEIVFALIRVQRLSRSDRDDPADFDDLFDLDRALADGFELTVAPAAGKGER